MLPSYLHLTPTEGMSRPEWLALRQHSIGGSDMSTLLGMNEYSSARELFYRFTESEGDLSKQRDSLPMLMGHELEPVVAKMWEHWGGDEESLVTNMAASTPVACCQPFPFHIKNPAADHLHANIDRLMIANHEGRQGILEIKTIASLAGDKYEAGFPSGYLIQVQHYLLVCEQEYAELAILKDGRKLEVVPVERNDDIITTMIGVADDFWRRVTEARAAMRGGLTGDKLRQELAYIEPAAEATPAFEQFLRSRWRTGGNTDVLLKGTEADLAALYGYQNATIQVKAEEAAQQGYKNQLLDRLAGDGADVLTLPDGHKVTFRADKHGKRTFRINQPPKK